MEKHESSGIDGKQAGADHSKNPFSLGAMQGALDASAQASAEFSGIPPPLPPPMQQVREFDWHYFNAELANDDDFVLLDLLREAQVPITALVDENGLTILHHAVLNGVDGKVQVLVDFAMNEQSIIEEEIYTWVNLKTYDEWWTALHYASFSGNLDAIYTLLEYKADMHALNSNRLNMLHVASQGDNPAPLYLFKMLGLSIDATDKRGSTPLLWACYS